VISLTLRRFRVICLGDAAAVAVCLPWFWRRKSSSLPFWRLLMTWSGSSNGMPASASWVSSLSPGIPSRSANCLIVTSDIVSYLFSS
jgi:hypothetical protein